MSRTSSVAYWSSLSCVATSNSSPAPSPSKRVPVSLKTRDSRLDTAKWFQPLPFVKVARSSVNVCPIYRAESQLGTSDTEQGTDRQRL